MSCDCGAVKAGTTHARWCSIGTVAVATVPMDLTPDSILAAIVARGYDDPGLQWREAILAKPNTYVWIVTIGVAGMGAVSVFNGELVFLTADPVPGATSIPFSHANGAAAADRYFWRMP